MKLSDMAVRQAKPQAKPYKLPDGTGLYLLVNKSGKYWRYDYRFEGKRKTIAYGVYPAISLSMAREAHISAKRLLAEGVDPMAAKKAAQLRVDETTFLEVTKQWFKQWRTGVTKKHATDVWRRLEIDVLPELGPVPITKLSAGMVRKTVQNIEKRGAFDMARRQLQKCNQVMRYALAHDLVETNPVAGIQPSDILQSRPKRNYVRIDAKDLPKLLTDIDGYVGGEHTRLALQLMALTFVRTSELIKATWPEFDLKAGRWEIPAERMKMRTPHIVPLSNQAMQVLEALQAISYGSDYVFPSESYKSKHMSNNTVLYALYRLGYRGRMTGHGFRGVASTILHEKGWPHAHIELQLAHQRRNAVAAAYNYALYIEPRTKMMQWWGDYLDELRQGRVLDLPKKQNKG